MRITNQMMTNNVMSGINRNMNNLSILDQQYYSGKKIQRPSEDPIIAVRALKLRTNLSELNQYYEKNIPDARNWMELTEGALKNINEMLTKINTECVSGANDPLDVESRNSIVKNLEQYKKQIYAEGNANYGGRYLFTGYKTDKSLTYLEPASDYTYEIKEEFTGTDIEKMSLVIGSYSVTDYDASNDYSKSPELTEVYRLRLSYDELDKVMHDGTTDGISVKVGTEDKQVKVTSLKDTSVDPYKPDPDKINFIPETGELIIGETVYAGLKNAANITVKYAKTNFEEGELRPEHYFDCEAYAVDGSDNGKPIVYVKENQEIQYEINFNQRLTINTQGRDAITHAIGRDIDEIIDAVNDVIATEEKIAEVKKMLADSKYAGETEQLEKELTLKKTLMQQKFGNGITDSQNAQNQVSVANADLGSRYVRLELTANRLSDQQIEFTDLMSNNEGADMVETYIKLNSAQLIYNASLAAASKVVQNTLLDFL